MATADQPDSTAVRTALWRALHVEHDPAPHVVEDALGLALADPPAGWQRRGDMDAARTSRARASIVARARFTEDLVAEQLERGVDQYVILGAGLDTFVQRRPELATRLSVYEIDAPSTQRWKQRRLEELGVAAPSTLHFVPVDFEIDSWRDRLVGAGFDESRPAVVACAGVMMYLTDEANDRLLADVATLAPGSTFVVSFMVPGELVEPSERRSRQATEDGARRSGTPFVSFFAPDDLVARATAAGFRSAHHVSHLDLASRYFAGRTDGLVPSSSEQIVVAST